MKDPSGGVERLFDVFVRCYSRAVRGRFENALRDGFRAEYAEARDGGVREVAAFWFWTAVDAARFGLADRGPQGGLPPMKTLFTIDVKEAVRSLRATPVVTVIAIASLALGIGANAALFSILNSLMFKTLPVRDPARLVVVADGTWTNPIWEQIRDHRHDLFEDAFAWSSTRFNLSDSGATDFVNGAWASGGMFEVLGVTPLLGRTFTPADDVRGGGPGGPVALISHAFWQRRFGGAPDVVGRSLSISGIPVTVAGVMPASFSGPEVGRRADIIVPIGVRALMPGGTRTLDGRSMWWLDIMARLRPDETIQQATARLDAIQPEIRRATLPQEFNARGQAEYLKEPLALLPAATGTSDLRHSYLAPLEVALAVVGAVLLIACANLANLLLARAAARRHEMSVRMALGATRWRLAKQLLTESVMLAGAGAGLGLLIARWGGGLLVGQLSTDQNLVTLDLSTDWRVVAFTAAIAAATTLVFGVAPVFGVNGVAPQDALKEHGRTVVGERRLGIRNALVAGQVALSLTLLVAAALFVRSLNALVNAPLGFDAQPLLEADVNGSRVDGRDARLTLYESLRSNAAAVPGISGAALSVLNPAGNMGWNTEIAEFAGEPSLSRRERTVWVNIVSPTWFETFGMRVLAGRAFDSHDVKGAPLVTVITESLARRLFPGGDAVGRDIKTALAGETLEAFRIVGVVNDSIYRSQRAGLQPIMFAPLAQIDEVMGSVVLTARAANGIPETLTHDLGSTIERTNPQLAYTIQPVSDHLVAAIRQERLVAMLGAFFGALALVLAAVGLYGVTSYGVNRRRAEIGVRMALGANPSGVIRLVLARLVMLLAVGVGAGLALSLWTSRFVATLLFGLGPRDPLTFASAAALLAAIGLLAGWLPARRAARIDPVRVLREQ